MPNSLLPTNLEAVTINTVPSPAKTSPALSVVSADAELLKSALNVIAQPELLPNIRQKRAVIESLALDRGASKDRFLGIRTYVELEKFILHHSPPITQHHFSAEELHAHLLQEVQVAELSLPFQVYFLPSGKEQNVAFFELCLQVVGEYVTTRLGTERLRELITATLQNTAVHDWKLAVRQLRFVVGADQLRELSTADLMSSFKTLYAAVYQDVRQTLGESQAQHSFQQAYQIFCDLYSRELLNQFLQVAPKGVLEAERIESLSHEQLQQVLKQLREEKGKVEEARVKDIALINSIGEGVLAVDQGQKLVFINQSALEMLQWQETELIGQVWHEVISAQDENSQVIPVEQRPIYLAFKEKKRISSNALYFVRKNGTCFPVAMTATPVIVNHTVTGTVVVFRDISKEKEIDRAKTEFISIASHQLRTPLGSMKWNLQMLLKGYYGQLPAEVETVIHEVLKSNEHMISLANNLLDVSRIDQGKIRDESTLTDILPILEAALQEIRPVAEHQQVAVEFQPATGKLPQLFIDPRRFREVVQNLLSNAVKFNHTQGVVKMLLSWDDAAVHIAIYDTGIGVPAAAQAKLFSRFFRAENAMQAEPGGTGLGLFVVKSYVEQWKGRTWFESPPEHVMLATNQEQFKTVFYIDLPVPSAKTYDRFATTIKPTNSETL